MAKFVKIAYQKDMLKVQENGKDVWYNCDPKAKGFAGKTFKEGDEIELKMETREDGPYVTQVCRPGNNQQSGGYHQNNYSKPANTQATPPATQSSNSTGKFGAKTPEESRKITKLSVMSSAAQAVQVVTGQVDPNTLAEYTVEVYNRLLAEIDKP